MKTQKLTNSLTYIWKPVQKDISVSCQTSNVGFLRKWLRTFSFELLQKAPPQIFGKILNLTLQLVTASGKAPSQMFERVLTLSLRSLMTFAKRFIQMFDRVSPNTLLPEAAVCRCSQINILKNFAIFTIKGKHLCWSLFLIKLHTFKPTTFLKRDSNTGVFM